MARAVWSLVVAVVMKAVLIMPSVFLNAGAFALCLFFG
jgi:hypothetical protein